MESEVVPLSPNEKLQKSFSDLGVAMRLVGEAIAEAIKPALEAIVEVSKKLHESMWKEYREAGMPFGETDEGMLKWLRVKGELNAQYWAAQDRASSVAFEKGAFELGRELGNKLLAENKQE
jgi:hypothetical protein